MDKSLGEKKLPPPPPLPDGPNRELLRIGGAALRLLSGGGAASTTLLRRGDFSILSSKKPSSPFSFLSCAVSDHHWPLPSDSPVLRLSPTRFSFSFPSLFYCLTLPHPSSPLLSILSSFSNFRDLQLEFVEEDSEEDFWAAAYGKMGGGVCPPPPLRVMEERALRVSAATKLVARVVVQAAVDPGRHFEVGGTAGKGCVVAGVGAVAEVVSAVEGAAAAAAEGEEKAVGWRFSAAGLELVLRVVAAVTARLGGAAATVENEDCRGRRSACRSSMT